MIADSIRDSSLRWYLPLRRTATTWNRPVAARCSHGFARLRTAILDLTRAEAGTRGDCR